MSKAQQREKSAAMAAYMKARPNEFPDSVRKPHNGCGSENRKASVPYTKNPGQSKWMAGMFGGVLAARLGYGSANVPSELI